MKLNFEKMQVPAGTFQKDWENWHWQLRNSLKSAEDFQSQFSLYPSETEAFRRGKEVFNIRATPYYCQLAGAEENDPIRRILMPHQEEITSEGQSQPDPLGEKLNSPVPRIVHRYPDRILFLVTDICSVYCRFCTRKHFTGAEAAFIKEAEYQNALDYITSHKGVREIILSGGDPLTLSDQHLERVLSDLRRIEHIEIIRIGTRMPVVCPMRVTEALVKTLQKYNPVFLMTHFNHPRELTLQAKEALELFVDHGIPVFNQMVLLNGVNNHPAIVQALSRRLLFCRVKPYYMFQLDPVVGSNHLKTSIEDSMAIQKELWGHLSGLAMPNLSLDIPSGGGKVGLVPEFQTSQSERGRTYRGFDGIEQEYLNPHPGQFIIPIDAEKYQAEWDSLKKAKES